MSNPIDLKLTAVPYVENFLGYYDISIDSVSGDFDLEDGLDTNLIMSMFCERRANSGEVGVPWLRRGWWGNELSDESGFEIGSKLWLLYQSRLTTSVQTLMQTYISDSLSWLVSDGIASKVNVQLTPNNRSGSITANIQISRKDGTTNTKYYDIWKASGRS